MVSNRNNLTICERRGYLLSPSLLTAKFLSSMFTFLHHIAGTIERKNRLFSY